MGRTAATVATGLPFTRNLRPAASQPVPLARYREPAPAFSAGLRPWNPCTGSLAGLKATPARVARQLLPLRLVMGLPALGIWYRSASPWDLPETGARQRLGYLSHSGPVLAATHCPDPHRQPLPGCACGLPAMKPDHRATR